MTTAVNSSPKNTILVVDNQVLIQDFIKFSLNDMFQVVSVYSAEQALNRLEYYGPSDVVLSSLSLSGMTGLELLQIIHKQYPNTLRILMSGGSTDHKEINHALEHEHIHRFLQKPFSPSALKSQLKKDLISLNGRIIF